MNILELSLAFLAISCSLLEVVTDSQLLFRVSVMKVMLRPLKSVRKKNFVDLGEEVIGKCPFCFWNDILSKQYGLSTNNSGIRLVKAV